MVPTKKSSKSSEIFHCEICNLFTCRRSQYERHLLTRKHKILLNPTKKVPENIVCECGKTYQHKSTLYAHKKTCYWKPSEQEVFASPVTDASNNVVIPYELVMELLKQNSEFKELLKDQNQQMIDLIGKGTLGNTTNNNTNTNSHNVTNKNRFNLNFFLNEQCKDAMNIMDFVNTIQLQLSDLERVGELGYVKGISHIVVNKLKDMDIHKRPIHCSDLKRETMYVKDQDIWEKENENKEKLSKMITHVAHKNQKQIGTWQKENPEYKDSESTTCDKYLKIVGESMSGLTHDDESEGYTNKIIKNIAKEVTIKEE